MSEPTGSRSALKLYTKRLWIAAACSIVALVGVQAVLTLGKLLPSTTEGVLAVSLLYRALDLLVTITAVGAIVGSLLVAARRDDGRDFPEDVEPATDRFE